MISYISNGRDDNMKIDNIITDEFALYKEGFVNAELLKKSFGIE